MSCVTQVKAALARFLFCCHALVTVWRVVSQVGISYLGIWVYVYLKDVCTKEQVIVRFKLAFKFTALPLPLFLLNALTSKRFC